MSYLIAVASSNGVEVDRAFGETDNFYIFEAFEQTWQFKELRRVPEETSADKNVESHEADDSVTKPFSIGEYQGSFSASGCSGMHDGSGGCGPVSSVRADLVSDCRALLVTRIGFRAARQVGRKNISVFEINGPVAHLFPKILSYYERQDQRKIQHMVQLKL